MNNDDAMEKLLELKRMLSEISEPLINKGFAQINQKVEDFKNYNRIDTGESGQNNPSHYLAVNLDRMQKDAIDTYMQLDYPNDLIKKSEVIIKMVSVYEKVTKANEKEDDEDNG